MSTEKKHRASSFHLHDLIHSLSRGEIKYYKQILNINDSKESGLDKIQEYKALFAILEKQSIFNDQTAHKTLRQYFPNITYNNYRVKKQYLYQHILKAMRAYPGSEIQINKDIKFKILDIRFLIEKALYHQADKELQKLKHIVQKYQRDIDMLEICRLEIILANAIQEIETAETRSWAIKQQGNESLSNTLSYIEAYTDYLQLQPLMLSDYTPIKISWKEYQKINTIVQKYQREIHTENFEINVIRNHIIMFHHEITMILNNSIDWQQLFNIQKKFVEEIEADHDNKIAETSPTNYFTLWVSLLRYSQHIDLDVCEANLDKLEKIDFRSLKVIITQRYIVLFYRLSICYQRVDIEAGIKFAHEALNYLKQYKEKLKPDEQIRLQFAAAMMFFINGEHALSTSLFKNIVNSHEKTFVRKDLLDVCLIMVSVLDFILQNPELKRNARNTLSYLKRHERLGNAEKYILNFLQKDYSQKHLKILVNKLKSIASVRNDESLLMDYFRFDLWFKSVLLNSEFVALLKQGNN